LQRVATFLRPAKRVTPDEWGAANRSYPPTSGHPGPRDPSLTPYMTPFARSIASGMYTSCIAVTSAQSGKTETILDVMGHRLAQKPAPVAYAGPTDTFNKEQFGPRLTEMLDDSPDLAPRTLQGQKNKLTSKIVNGVPVRLVSARSSSALKSFPAVMGILDEYDEMVSNIGGQGDPFGLLEVRGDTYADFVAATISTPSHGSVETEVDPVSGLEFWKVADPEEVGSPIWRLFQEGTRHHWAWDCPHCGEPFIPMGKHLVYDDEGTAAEAAASAHMVCPSNGCVIEDDKDGATKAAMNVSGFMIAPGQTIEEAKRGDPVAGFSRYSQWSSGLCSPFVNWSIRAERIHRARLSLEPNRMQTAINANLGELYTRASLGDMPEWRAFLKRKTKTTDTFLDPHIIHLVMGADVQANGIYWVIRGFGWLGTSFLVDRGFLMGNTAGEEVWDDLAQVFLAPVMGMQITKVFVDAGFRPNKKDAGSPHKVYAFAHQYDWLVSPTKGRSRPSGAPLTMSRIEVDDEGQRSKYSIGLAMLDTDFFKSLVHSRIKTPMSEPGAFHLNESANEEYARQVLSETRVVTLDSPNPAWVQNRKDNHFFDCFDPETELLTEDGWLPVTDAVSHKGRFASVNLDRDTIEYQAATNSVSRWHEGEMVSIVGRSVDLLVTPNHRLVTYRRNPAEDKPKITLAKDLTIWNTLKRTARWEGQHHDTVVLPEHDVPSTNGRRLYEAVRSFDAGDWCEFLGWFVSGGHVSRRGNYAMVVLSQSPGTKADLIAALLSRMGVAYRLQGGRQFVIPSRQLAAALSDCWDDEGSSRYGKRVPAFVRAGSPDLIERFVDAAILGDGWMQGAHRSYATVSRRLADDMQELFIKSGRSGKVTRRKAKPYLIRGRASGNTVDQFHVSEIRTPQAHLRRADNSPVFANVSYAGMVYCVTVPNGTLIARRNGKAIIVGNCEALAAAAGFVLNVQTIPRGTKRTYALGPDAASEVRKAPKVQTGGGRFKRKGS